MTSLSLIEDRSEAFRSAVAAAPGLDARVPGCPDWTLHDLVRHLGRVQRFWASAVAAADVSGPPPVPAEPVGDLVEWFGGSTAALLDALRAADPDAPCWAWWPPSAAPLTV